MKIYYNPTINENGKHSVFMYIYDRDASVQEVSIHDTYGVLLIDESNQTLFEAWRLKLKPIFDSMVGTEIRFKPLEIEVTEADKLESLRVERNKALAETDWMMASDTPLTVQEKTDITAYRQELRDITNPIKEGTATVDEITLPEKPLQDVDTLPIKEEPLPVDELPIKP